MRPKKRPSPMDLVKAWEDVKIFGVLDRMSLCEECLGIPPEGVVFGCDSCLKHLAREVMET